MANPLMDHEIKALKEMGKIRQEAIDQMLVDDLMPNEWRLACQMVVRAFDAWMRAKPVDIGNTIRRNLITYRRTGNPVGPLYKHDAGNGAAMRILPVALAALGSTESTACDATRAQAHVTHNNPVSDAACEFIVLAVQDFLRVVYRQRIAPFIAAHPEFAFRRRRCQNPSGWIVDTMQAVLQSLLETDSVESCLIDVVNRGGDAGSTGAIAGMLAGALYGRRSIPQRWEKVLDPGVRTACLFQATALASCRS